MVIHAVLGCMNVLRHHVQTVQMAVGRQVIQVIKKNRLRLVFAGYVKKTMNIVAQLIITAVPLMVHQVAVHVQMAANPKPAAHQ